MKYKPFIIASTIFLALTSAAQSAQKFSITGNDQMQFSLREFEVKAGEEVEIEFKNIGKLPKIAMGHNLVILKKGLSAIAFGAKAASSGANATNALPDSVKGDVLAYTKLLGPGEKVVLKFKAPLKTGVHQFLCSFPGHYAIMRGVMTVN